MDRRHFVGLLPIFVQACVSAGAAADTTLDGTIRASLLEYDVPGLQIAATVHGNSDLTAAFGVRDSVSKEPVTDETIFEAASLSKPVFAFLVNQLSENGQLDLDRPLLEYLGGPYSHEEDPFHSGLHSSLDVVQDPRFSRITARMVLSHTSGLPNWAVAKPLKLVANPGSEWNYSGEGYVFLQRVVEHITNSSLQTLADQIVFQPFGMTSSTFVWSDRIASLIAIGHDKLGHSQPLKRHVTALAPTSLYTTASDYVRFFGALASPATTQVRQLSAQMRTRTATADPRLQMYWGLGLGLEKLDRETLFFHWGSDPGYNCFAMGSERTGYAFTFLTNSDNGLEAAPRITNHLIRGPHPLFRSKYLKPNG